MGSGNGISRGQLRPHFSGRSPPFLLAALCVGLGILGISYWSLSQQYNQLEDQLKRTLLKKESIENDLNFIQNQLSVREEKFSQTQQDLQKKDQALSSAVNDVKTKTDEVNEVNKRLETLKESDDKCNQDLDKKTNELADSLTKLKDIEQQNSGLNDKNREIIELKEKNKELETILQEMKNQLKTSLNKTQLLSVVSESSVSNVVNKPNIAIISTNNTIKATEDVINKPDSEPIVAANGVDTLNDKPLNEVIVEPPKVNQLSTNDLAEEDRKEESLVEANEVNNNEVLDQIRPDLKDNEEMKPQLK